MPANAPATVAVAASGGRDSTALLHCTTRVAAVLGLRVVALHVHHGLMPQADAWAARVRGQCRRWGAGFAMARLEGAPAKGDSVEAWARRGRYEALARLAKEQGATLVLLAHHRRDQAETLLLQALRAAGAAGLAAMPPVAARDGLTWARPWLSWPRAAIEAYLRQHRLRPVDDPSNADPRFARSRLRANVWPVLAEAFPDAESALAGAASRAAEAAQLAREVAAQDLAQTCVDGALDIGAWRALPPGRRANALRAWLDAVLPTGAPGTLVQRLLAELPGRRAARWPAGAGWLVLYRGRLRPEASATAARTALTEPAADGGLHRCGRHAVPGSDGTLQVSAARTGGLPAQALEGAVWRARTGGEQFQREPGTPPRSLKKAYQFAGVPAHERHAPLLVAADGALLFVPGLGLDARALARPGSPRRALHWHPRGAGRA